MRKRLEKIFLRMPIFLGFYGLTRSNRQSKFPVSFRSKLRWATLNQALLAEKLCALQLTDSLIVKVWNHSEEAGPLRTNEFQKSNDVLSEVVFLFARSVPALNSDRLRIGSGVRFRVVARPARDSEHNEAIVLAEVIAGRGR